MISARIFRCSIRTGTFFILSKFVGKKKGFRRSGSLEYCIAQQGSSYTPVCRIKKGHHQDVRFIVIIVSNSPSN
jgi:hypothetical protein